MWSGGIHLAKLNMAYYYCNTQSIIGNTSGNVQKPIVNTVVLLETSMFIPYWVIAACFRPLHDRDPLIVIAEERKVKVRASTV